MAKSEVGRLRSDAVRNRQRILAAARDLFASQGLEPSLNDIARHAGVGVGTIYRRFATKEALLDEVFAEEFNGLAALAKEGLGQEDPWQGFADFVTRVCELTAVDRGLREIAFGATCVSPSVHTARERLTVTLVELADHAKSKGCLRQELSHLDVHILAILAGAVSDFAGQEDGHLWRRYVAFVLDGMRSR